jgi:hypothetical protein
VQGGEGADADPEAAVTLRLIYGGRHVPVVLS